MNIQRPSSSCFYDWTYDVFLNFRGKDTRTGFAGSLYNALRESGIHTFFDDEAIKRGEEISPSLFKAIEESRLAITILSPDYASSEDCLDELVHILKCIKGQGRLVWTVFYHVDPSQLQDPEGIFKEPLAEHEKIYGKEKVQTWRSALSEAAGVAGLEIKKGIGYEYDYIKKIIKDISTTINRTPLHVTDHPVGLESRVLDINSLLEIGSNEGVHMVGIWGIGGVGKTTIARAVYNLIAKEFDGSCFLSNVRDISNKHGLSHLQETLLAKLVGEKDVKLGGVNEGASLIEHRLRKKKVLLVLDDVNDRKQLNAMARKCNWFGRGSRIIITTRDEGLLKDHEVDRIYTVKQLNYVEALQLFSWKAFGKDEVDPSYMEISNRVVRYSSGLPLALEVIGSNFHHSKQNEWISLLDGYNKTPDIKIFEVLKLSYDQLGYSERQIFLDVACFFNLKYSGYLKDTLLKVRNIKSEYHIGELIRKSLIKVEYGCIIMHDLVQDMGKEIIRQESDIEPGGRSRLWFYKDILHVLQENTGTDKIEVLILDLPKGKKEVQWNEKAFEKMKNLKMLIIKNTYFTSGPTHLPNSLRLMDWSHYPGNALPFDFHPTNRCSLDLPKSSLVSLGPFLTKNMENLTTLNFRGCKFLRQVTDLSGVPNLEKFNLDFCPSLIEIHDSVGFLSKLRVLRAQYCVNLTTLPRGINLTSLEFLQFYGCSSLQSFPEVLGKMEKTIEIKLDKTAIKELPYSIQNINGLRQLTMRSCQHLKQFPASLLKLPKLSQLTANNFQLNDDSIEWKAEEGKGMSSIESSSSNVELDFRMCNVSYESISLFLSWLPNLRRLDLSYSTITILPICIKECHHLKKLYVNNCEQLQQIEGMPPNLEFLQAENCLSITILPICIKECHHLKELYVNNCEQLQQIEAMPPNLEFLEAENCLSLTFQSLSMLMHQAFFGPGRRQFSLPGQEVPQWFHHYSDGYSTEFWVRKEFPVLVVCCVVIATWDDYRQIDVPLHVNGHKMWFRYGISRPLKGNHIILYHVRQDDFCKDTFQSVFLPDQWNHVEIFGNDNGTIKPIGVHVYEQENVQFSRPNPSIESSSSKVTLAFRNCNLSYESLSCLSSLPNVECLDLSYSTITILPIWIKECHHLKDLFVNNCEQLQQIEGIPPNLELLHAKNCLSLTFQSSSMLMHQALRGPGRREFILPGQEVPQWLHRYSYGYSTEFWVRKEFPVLAVCYVMIATSDEIISLWVNGCLMWIKSVSRGIFCSLKGNHIFLCHVRQDDFFKDAFQRVFLPEQWNHVEIFGNNGTIKSIGVHVYEQENVQFSRPNPLKKTGHHQCDVNKDSNSIALASACDAISDRGATTLDYPSMSKPEDEVTKLSLNTHESTIAEMRVASSIGIGRHRNNGRIRYAVFLGGFAIVLFVVTMCMSLASRSRGHDCHVNLVPT